MKIRPYLSTGLFLSILYLCTLSCALAQDAPEMVVNPKHRIGIDYACEGKFKEAGEWFKQHLETDKKDSTSLGALGVIDDLNRGKITKEYTLLLFKSLNSLQDGQIEEGIKELLNTIEVNPNYYRPYNMLGAAYAFLGDTGKASDYFMKAIKINPNYSEAYFNLAALRQSLGQAKEAIEYYRKVIQLKADSVEAITNTAAIYSSLGEYAKAINYYRTALRINKNDPDLYYNLALAYFMSDQVLKFKDNLEKAEKLYKQQGDEIGLQKVAEYMNKLKELEEKIKKHR